LSVKIALHPLKKEAKREVFGINLEILRRQNYRRAKRKVVLRFSDDKFNFVKGTFEKLKEE